MVLHRALLHDVAAARGVEGQGDVLLHEQDGHPILVKPVDDVADLAHHPGHEALRRLVEEDDPRVQHHGARDGQHLLLAARQGAPGLAAALGQHGEVAEDLLQQLVLARLGHSRPVEAGAQVLGHREQPEHPAVLGDPRDAHVGEPVRRQPGHVPLVPAHSPPGGAHQPRDRLEGGALADAVPAEQPHHLPGLHLEGHPVQDVALAVVGVDVVEAEHQVFR